MLDQKIEIKNLIDSRNDLLEKQKKLYISTVEKINMNTRELLNNDFGSLLVRNIGRDIAGEMARRFFDLGDYYMTVDQLYDRLVNFSYDNDVDLLLSDDNIRKEYYNYSDSINSKSIKEISEMCQNAQQKLFVEDRAQDKLDLKGKKEYRQSKITQDGKIYDELTGKEGNTNIIIKNGKEVRVSDLQADHVQARESARYNERYIQEKKIESLKEFFNSADNMQMMHASANASKGDVRVCEINGKTISLNAKEMKSRQEKGENIIDITHKATPEQLAEATIEQWEKETPSSKKIETLKEKGYLDENGKVKPNVKKELINNIKHSQNVESIKILNSTDYKKVSKDALKMTKASFKKILAGQVIYYMMPPAIFETKILLRKKYITLDNFFDELKKSSKRIVKYASSKMGQMLKNITSKSLSKFLKSFFDIIIELLKATVKRLVKVIKSVVMSLVNCIKVLMDKNSTANQKADSITKILTVTITNVVMEILFEYLEKQFGLPNFLMEALQVIVSVLSTNIIMLVLQKLDLFNVQYGLLVSNIEKIFNEENNKYLMESELLYENSSSLMNEQMNEIELEIEEIKNSISELNVYKEDVVPYLKKISEMFSIDIDFDKEWTEFLAVE